MIWLIQQFNRITFQKQSKRARRKIRRRAKIEKRQKTIVHWIVEIVEMEQIKDIVKMEQRKGINQKW